MISLHNNKIQSIRRLRGKLTNDLNTDLYDKTVTPRKLNKYLYVQCDSKDTLDTDGVCKIF